MNKEEVLQNMDVKHALFGTFFSFNNRLQTAGDAFYKEITCKQFFLMICLSLFQEEPPTINELSIIMGSTHQNVKQIVNKLEEAGYVETKQDEVDKRKLRVSATEKISILSEKYKEQESSFMNGFYEGISETDIKAVFSILTRLEKNLITIQEECR